MIRRATAEDIPWMVTLALKAYGERIKDPTTVAPWLARTLQNPDVVMLRSDDALIVAGVQRFFYDPQPEGRLIYLLRAKPAPWQILALLRAAMAWAKSKGCAIFTARNGTDHDLGPLMRRLGRTQQGSFYQVALDV